MTILGKDPTGFRENSIHLREERARLINVKGLPLLGAAGGWLFARMKHFKAVWIGR